MIPELHSLPADDPAGCAESVAGPPRRSLRAFVAGYGGFRAADGYLPQRMLPVNLTTVIIDFTGRPGLVTGPRRTPLVRSAPDWRHGVAIGLTPAGVAALLGTPVRDLVGTTVAADALLGRRAAELADRLAGPPDWAARSGTPDWAARFAVLDDRLAGWLRPARRVDPLAVRAWWRLAGSAGGTRIGGLADELGVSRRRLEYGFQRHIGLPPKTVARIARFQRAVHRLGAPTARPALAADCGYADQAHLNRDFRALAGITPTELFAFLQDLGGPAR